jgi:hypothetical protein
VRIPMESIAPTCRARGSRSKGFVSRSAGSKIVSRSICAEDRVHVKRRGVTRRSSETRRENPEGLFHTQSSTPLEGPSPLSPALTWTQTPWPLAFVFFYTSPPCLSTLRLCVSIGKRMRTPPAEHCAVRSLSFQRRCTTGRRHATLGPPP